MAEYAATYGGLPDPASPWPLFLALSERCARFEARARLRLMDSVSTGIGMALEGNMSARSELMRIAYPASAGDAKPVVNLARNPEADTPTDG